MSFILCTLQRYYFLFSWQTIFYKKDCTKYNLEENRLRILVGNCELVGNKIICDKIEFKVLSKKLYKNLDKGGCYFLIDNKNRIVSEQINHIFCPYEI